MLTTVVILPASSHIASAELARWYRIHPTSLKRSWQCQGPASQSVDPQSVIQWPSHWTTLWSLCSGKATWTVTLQSPCSGEAANETWQKPQENVTVINRTINKSMSQTRKAQFQPKLMVRSVIFLLLENSVFLRFTWYIKKHDGGSHRAACPTRRRKSL